MGTHGFDTPGKPEIKMRYAIECLQVSLGYADIPRVTGLDCRIPGGAAIAVIGPNGSGKSTILHGFLGLSELQAGEISVLGTSPVKARSQTGLLPQVESTDRELPLTLTQVVRMGLYARLGAFKRVGRDGSATVTAALDRVGLRSYGKRLFGELSGGQQQRGMLARALVAEPKLLLLDEPFNGLDRENRDTLLSLMSDFRAEGRTIIVSTHDLEIAREACSHVLLLESGQKTDDPGRVVFFGTVEDAAQRALLLPADCTAC